MDREGGTTRKRENEIEVGHTYSVSSVASYRQTVAFGEDCHRQCRSLQCKRSCFNNILTSARAVHSTEERGAHFRATAPDTTTTTTTTPSRVEEASYTDISPYSGTHMATAQSRLYDARSSTPGMCVCGCACDYALYE